MASWLVFLAGVDLHAPVGSLVHMGDASSKGFALLSTRAAPHEVRHELKVRERWRFTDVSDEFQPAAVDVGLCDQLAGLCPLGGPDHDHAEDPPLFSPGQVAGRAPRVALRRPTEFEKWVSTRLREAPSRPAPRTA